MSHFISQCQQPLFQFIIAALNKVAEGPLTLNEQSTGERRKGNSEARRPTKSNVCHVRSYEETSKGRKVTVNKIGNVITEERDVKLIIRVCIVVGEEMLGCYALKGCVTA